MPVSAACCAGRAAPLPPPPRRSAPAGWACLPAMPHQRGFPAKSVGRQAFHSCPLAIRPCAELRVEDVLAEVEDLLRAPDPQRITLPGRPRRRAIEPGGRCICARTAASRDWGPCFFCGSLTEAACSGCPPAAACCCRVCPLLRTDLQRCGAAGTIIGLLLDVNLFWEVRGDSMLGCRSPRDEEQQARRMSSELSYSFADASGP